MAIAPELVALLQEGGALAKEGIIAAKDGVLALSEAYKDIGIIANARTKIFLSKFLKNAPDLAKLLKEAQKLQKNKVLKEAIKEVSKQIEKLF